MVEEQAVADAEATQTDRANACLATVAIEVNAPAADARQYQCTSPRERSRPEG